MGERKQAYSTRLDPDVGKAVDRYAEDNGLTQSEAVRRLVETGLETGSGPSNEDVRADIRDDLEDMKESIESIEADRDDDAAEDAETLQLGSAGFGTGSGLIEVVQLALLLALTVLVVSGGI